MEKLKQKLTELLAVLKKIQEYLKTASKKELLQYDEFLPPREKLLRLLSYYDGYKINLKTI